MIDLVHVSKRFGSLVVLDDVSMHIEKGKTTAIIGPSGTGKSVLLKHIVGLLEPDSGQVLVDGVDMARASESRRYQVRKKLGMLFQDGALFDSLSTGENIEFPLRYHTRLNERERREKVEEALEMVKLPGLYDRPTAALSGGQRKRVGLARAIVTRPECILFDEPNSGLDPLTSDTIDDLISDLKNQLGITFVVITHDIIQAVRIADAIAMLYRGHLVEYAPTQAFLRTRQQVVRDFLRRNIDLPEPDGELIPAP